MNPKITKKHAIVLVVALIALFIIIVGGSYAFFTNTVRGKEYVVYSGTLAVSYEKKTNVVNLNNTKPMTNTEGLATTAYSFDVKNTGTIEEKYQVRLEEDTNNTLPLEYVKISVYKNDTELLKPTKLSELSTNLVIGEGELDSLDSDNYKVRLWVDINTSNDMVGKEFKARVVIDSMQDVEEGFAVNTKPVITLKKDSNNNTNLILNVGDTYTELGVESVRDDKDTISPNNVAISGTVNTNVAGIYTVTYSVTDSDNNTSTVTRTVAVNDGSLPIYNSVSAVVNSFDSNDLKDVIICDQVTGNGDMFFNCEIKDKLADAINARNTSTIIVSKDFNVPTQNINSEKNITLYLNNHKLDGGANMLYVRGGTLHIIGDGMIRDTSPTVNSANGAIKLWGSDNSKLIIDGNRCNSTDPSEYSSGLLVYVDDSQQSAIANYGTNTDDGSTAYLEINGGCYYSTSGKGIVSTGKTYTVINNPYVYAGNVAAYTSTTNSVTNITNGVFISNSSYSIYNNSSTAVININQTDQPMYVTNMVESWKPAIYNYSTGTININANQANACTSTISDTTSGLCAYADGSKEYTSNTANAPLQNGGAGVINVNGGTYYGGHQGANNNAAGTLNIKNAEIISSYRALLNAGVGTINICNSSLNGSSRDIHNTSTGVITYSNITFSTGTTTPDSSKIYNPSGTLTQVSTCPIN